MARLSLDRAVKSYGTFNAVDDVTLTTEDGEFLAILGPSGCGKTTILRLVAGFERITRGTIRLGEWTVSAEGSHVPPEQRRVGVVFQSYALWPHMNVAENVGYPLRVARTDSSERTRRIAQALETVGLQGFDRRRPAELSGGQRQRVALARCLIMEPQILLLDEPLANLDTHLRGSMQREFAEYHRRTGTAMVYVTHDQAEAMALADRIAVMNSGKLIQLASPSRLYREPATRMVAEFIGQGTVIEGPVLTDAHQGRVRVRLFETEIVSRAAATQKATGSACIILRPEKLSVQPAVSPNSIATTVRRITYSGGAYAVEAAPCAASNATLQLIIPEPASIEVGARLAIEIRDGWVIPEA